MTDIAQGAVADGAAGGARAGDDAGLDLAAWGLAPAEPTPSRLEALLQRSLRREVGQRFDELNRMVDRRFAELSAEIHATVQLVDFSETSLTGQLARMQEQIAGLVAAPTLEGRNSGIELEAVVQTTETAANRIMEAAEAIDAWVRKNFDRPEQGGRQALGDVSDKINDIFEACSFQDLTSQRIRRAIDHLQLVDSMLGDLSASGARAASSEPPRPLAPPLREGMVATSGADLLQAEIDRLLAG